VERMKSLAQEIEPSFFEITVAMAFDFFAEQKVDVAIIEVGLGGRLDSTNIITPELSIITNIGWDHMNILGNSLKEISAEKAGIIKENIPVVIGEALTETRTVFENQAKDKNSRIIFAEEKFEIVSYQISNDHLQVSYEDENKKAIEIETDLPGIYQSKNLRTVLAAIPFLQERWKLSEENILDGFANVKKRTGLSGRWEVIHTNPAIILEVAHNKEGIQQMLKHLEQIRFNKLHIIIGTVRDKDVESILSLMPKKAVYYFTQANIPRALDKEELKKKAVAFGLNGNSFENVNDAIAEVKKIASEDDLIIVCGSIFLVAEVDRKFVEA